MYNIHCVHVQHVQHVNEHVVFIRIMCTYVSANNHVASLQGSPSLHKACVCKHIVGIEVYCPWRSMQLGGAPYHLHEM